MNAVSPEAPLAIAADIEAAPAAAREAKLFSVVLPAYDEAANLRRLLPDLRTFCQQRFERWEIVLVDDGSRDDTTAVIEEWAATCPQFVALELSRNFGKEAALSAGLEAARGDLVLQIDADGQHPLALIDDMLAGWRGGADVVYAVRADRRDESALKRWGTRAFYRLVQGDDRFTVPPDAGDFRLMDRRVVDALLRLPERNRFMKGLYAWVGFKTQALPYCPAPRLHGRSRYNYRRLASLSLEGLTAFTTWPLRVVSVIGMILALPAFLYGAFIVVGYFLWGNEVPGWTTVVVCLLLFAGIQMVSIGVLGEYVARIFDEVKGRPLYLVRRRIGRRAP